MKANIHPELKDAKVICACGATFNTKSSLEITMILSMSLVASFTISSLSHSSNMYFLFGLIETKTYSLSNNLLALLIMSRCPFEIGSNEPG